MNNKKSFRRVIAVLLSTLILLAVSLPAMAADTITHELLINEICSTNKGGNGNLTDVSYGDDYLDWVELYNPSENDINLGGYGLSDGSKNLYKFVFPDNAVIKAKGFLIVYCSKEATSSSRLIAPFAISSSSETIYLASKNGNLVDKLKKPSLIADITYSRVPDGSDTLKMTFPTPGISNNNAKYIYSSPRVSVKSGIYKEAFDLEIINTDSADGLKIYYTTDGSDPRTSVSAVEYTGKINIHDRTGEKNVLSAIDPTVFSPTGKKGDVPTDDEVDKVTVIRACVKDTMGGYSFAVTNTYFVGEKASSYGNITLVSLSTDESNLFDYNTGIYTKGKYYDEYKAANPTKEDFYGTQGNYSQKGSDWKRPAHVDYIAEDGNCVISQDCKIGIQGAISRSAVQKSFRLEADSKYGKSDFDYPIFEDAYDASGNVIQKYKSFILRNGGNDSALKFSDKINQDFVKNLTMDTQSAKPCYVFLNGEYWGTYVLTTDYSAAYIAEKYGVDEDDVIMYKNWKWEEGGTDADKKLLNDATNFIGYNGMSSNSNYEKAKTMIDFDSYIDYMCSQIYFCNGDWPQGNFALWRVRTPDESNQYADGKWRFMLFDTDLSTGIWSGSDKLATYNKLNQVMNSTTVFLAKMLQGLCANDRFVKLLAERFAEIISNNFNTENALAAIKNLYYGKNDINDTGLNYQSYLAKNWERYGFQTLHNSDKRITEMTTFYSKRQAYAISQLKSVLGLKNAYKVTVNSSVGSVNINGRLTNMADCGGSYTAYYFSDYPLNIQAQKLKGYTFKGFGGSLEQAADTAQLTLSEDMQINLDYVKIIYGDANGDSVINSKDVLLIRKCLANFDVDIDKISADINDDGIINIKDLFILRKYLAGIIPSLEQ